ncbi:MAG: LPS export ABC transporter periplasmic protein LptC [Bosea sp. (in: a-proteobacteria)]
MTFEKPAAEPRGGAAGAIQRAASSAKSYRLARQHSAFVRFLRMAIPVGAVVSFSVFIVFPFISPFRTGGVSVGAIKMDGTRVTMENPRMAGHRKDNRPYEVTASSAVQDIRVPNVIELNEMKARLVNADNSVLNLTARKAVFNSEKEQLQMREDVRVVTENGQEALMHSADVDFKAGTVRSRDGVRVRLPDMSVSADELDIVDSGGKIAFIGRVTALIDDKDSKASAGQQAPAQPSARLTQNPPASAGQSSTRSSPPPATALTVTGSPPRDARGTTVIDPNSGRAVARPAP